MKFVAIEPKRFHQYLVAEFYQKAVIAADEQSFTTEMHNTQFNVSPRFLSQKFGLNNSGVSISSYLDGIPNVKKEHWLQSKAPEYTKPFKLKTPKGSIVLEAGMMLDIVLKIIIQDVGSKAELSTRKYKPMMALEGMVEANWQN